MRYPPELRYAASHEWVRKDGELYAVGVTDFAQDALGDIVFVEPPAQGRAVKQGESCAVIESVKTASDLYSPLSGEVTEVNGALAENPELLNSEPYEGGWIFKLRAADPAELDNLLDADGYRESAESGGD